MVAKKNAKVSPRIITKARKVLEFAEERAKHVSNSFELHNALYSPTGKATELFATEAERTAFCKTEEYDRLLVLMNQLPLPPVQSLAEATANGAISISLPRSVHAALLAEAKAEGVTLNQLCLSKLVAQLRTVI